MKYSKEITDEICKHITTGASNLDAATMCGISESTFYEWTKKSEFLESIKKAQLKKKIAMVNRILRAASDTWTAAAWYLERVYPNEYGRYDRVEHEIKKLPVIDIRIRRAYDRVFKEEIRKESKPRIKGNGKGQTPPVGGK